MFIYKVWIGDSPNIIHDVVMARAHDCTEAEKKANKLVDGYGEYARVVKIEELPGDFIE